METSIITAIISGLVLSLVSGIAFLSIKHYDVYSKIFLYICGFVFYLFTINVFYWQGYNSAITNITKYLNEIKDGQEIDTLLFTINNSTFNKYAVYLLVFISYCILAKIIGLMINTHKKQK